MKRLVNDLKRHLCRKLCHEDKARIRFETRYPDTPIIYPLSIGSFYSQEGQDLYMAGLLWPIIESYEGTPYFFDIGCNHPTKYSNSLFFERYCGFTTIAVDPLSEYGQLWAKMRPNAVFEPVGLGAARGVSTIHVPALGASRDDMFSSLIESGSKTEACEVTTRQVNVTTFNDLARKHDITDVLICSIDVEGYEYEVLRAIDFDAVAVVCFCIENDTDGDYGRSEIRELLEGEGYVFHARLGKRDDVFLHRSVYGRIIV